MNITKCPNCGAPISNFCSETTYKCLYCDSIIDLTMGHSFEERMKIKEFESSKKMFQHSIEQEKNNKIERKKAIKTGIVASIALSGFSILLFILGGYGIEHDNVGLGMLIMIAAFPIFGIIAIWDSINKKSKKLSLDSYHAMIPEGVIDTDDNHFEVIVSKLKSAGFTNIELIPLKDLNFLNKRKNGKIKSIHINGEEEVEEGNIYDKDVPIIISYHSID